MSSFGKKRYQLGRASQGERAHLADAPPLGDHENQQSFEQMVIAGSAMLRDACLAHYRKYPKVFGPWPTQPA